MSESLTIILINCLVAIYFMLPAYLSNLSGLAFGGKTPADGNKIYRDGSRILGNGVTWEGTISGIIVGTIIGCIIGIVGLDIPNLTGNIILINMPQTLITGLIYGFLLATGALVGDAVGSFIKRRIGLESGEPAPLLDQLDFVFGAIIFIYPIIQLDIKFILIICIISIILHLVSNIIAYLLGLKNVWY